MQRRSIISDLLPVRANLRCCLDQLEHLLLASCGDDNTIQVWDLESGEHLQTLRRDRPYERLNITGIRGLSEAQKTSLRDLGRLRKLLFQAPGKRSNSGRGSFIEVLTEPLESL